MLKDPKTGLLPYFTILYVHVPVADDGRRRLSSVI
jgi:hypothetical protein